MANLRIPGNCNYMSAMASKHSGTELAVKSKMAQTQMQYGFKAGNTLARTIRDLCILPFRITEGEEMRDLKDKI